MALLVSSLNNTDPARANAHYFTVESPGMISAAASVANTRRA
jgi:hypothetical protein